MADAWTFLTQNWAATATIIVGAFGLVGVFVKSVFDRGAAIIATRAATQASKSKEHELYNAFNERVSTIVTLQADTIDRLNKYLIEREHTIEQLSAELKENTETIQHMSVRIDELCKALEVAGVPIPPEKNRTQRDSTRA